MTSMNIVVGSTGSVGRGILKTLEIVDFNFTVMDSHRLFALSAYEVQEIWFRILEQHEAVNVFWCAGIIDPNTPQPELSAVNFLFPKRHLSAAISKSPNVQFIFIGSVLENRDIRNPYLISKSLLSDWLDCEVPENFFKHVRTHTLLGDSEPPSHMFLGQLLDSARHNGTFVMSEGRQLRQYIDVSVFADFLVKDSSLHESRIPSGTSTVGGSRPCELRVVAEDFRKVSGRRFDLRIDKGLNHPGDQFEPVIDNVELPLPDSRVLVSDRLLNWLRFG